MSNIFGMTDTWNNGAVQFFAIQMNVTDTASLATSMLMDLQVAGVSKFNVNKLGNVTIGANAFGAANAQIVLTPNTGTPMGWQVASNGSVIHPISYGSAVLNMAIRNTSIDFSSTANLRWTNATNNPTTTTDTGIGRAGVPNSVVFNDGNAVGSATSRVEINKTITAIADATATIVFTVTIPNAAHSATIMVELDGDLGAGGAIGAFEAGALSAYRIKIVRTAGVNAVAVISATDPGAAANVVGANTCTVVGTLAAMTGAVGAVNTFNIQVTITKSAGTSANHTCTAFARLLNANATGVTIA